MNGETQSKIQKMLYHLSNENHASAGQELKEVIAMKVKTTFRQEYEKVKQSFSKENK